MSEWTWNIITAVISGLATTISAALLLWIINIVRNLWLKFKIKKIICKHSHLCGLMESLTPQKVKYSGIVIKNPSDIFLTIRSVWAESGEEGHSCRYPMDYIGPFFQEDITLPFDVSEHKERYGFVTLSPFTNGQWILRKEDLINCQYTSFNQLQIHVEYQTFFKNPKVIRVVIAKSEILDYLNKMLSEMSKKNESGIKNE
jgi:hypothetical protein